MEDGLISEDESHRRRLPRLHELGLVDDEDVIASRVREIRERLGDSNSEVGN